MTEDDHYFFEILTVLNHPKVTLSEISTSLGCVPTSGWSAGDSAPGRALPRTRSRTFWYLSRAVQGTRYFTQEIEVALQLLSAHAPYIGGFLKTGGEVRIDVRLPGTINIGDEFSPTLLRQIIELGVLLNVEVFPNLATEFKSRIEDSGASTVAEVLGSDSIKR
jgi:hypothetical protein